MATNRTMQDMLNEYTPEKLQKENEPPSTTRRARLGGGMGDVKIAEQGKGRVWQVLFDSMKRKEK